MTTPSRSTGVLLHPTALPGSPVCGSFGEPCRRWINLLADNNIGVWQLLPLAPPDGTGSPYNSPSSFALNPWFLDAEERAQVDFFGLSVCQRGSVEARYVRDTGGDTRHDGSCFQSRRVLL